MFIWLFFLAFFLENYVGRGVGGSICVVEMGFGGVVVCHCGGFICIFLVVDRLPPRRRGGGYIG